MNISVSTIKPFDSGCSVASLRLLDETAQYRAPIDFRSYNLLNLAFHSSRDTAETLGRSLNISLLDSLLYTFFCDSALRFVAFAPIGMVIETVARRVRLTASRLASAFAGSRCILLARLVRRPVRAFRIAVGIAVSILLFVALALVALVAGFVAFFHVFEKFHVLLARKVRFKLLKHANGRKQCFFGENGIDQFPA